MELIMSANTHHTKLKGDIAVAAVILDLTKKGYIISEPMSENAPYDLICDTGNKLLKIQVKYRKDGVIPYRTSWADKNGTHVSNIDTSKIDYFALVNEDYSKICYPHSTMKGCSIRFELPEGKFYNPFHYYEDYLNFENTIKPMRQVFGTGITIEEVKKITKEEFQSVLESSASHREVYQKLNISRKVYISLISKFNLEYSLLFKKEAKSSSKTVKSKKVFNLDLDFITNEISKGISTKDISSSLNITQKQLQSFLTKRKITISKIDGYKKVHPKKIEWPSKEELEKLLWEKPTTSIAKDLGVSDKAVEKHVKKLGLAKPPRGYWIKQKIQRKINLSLFIALSN